MPKNDAPVRGLIERDRGHGTPRADQPRTRGAGGVAGQDWTMLKGFCLRSKREIAH
jgi:hypothetical protein